MEKTDLSKKFIIMIGRSGSGKGTQAELLRDYLKKIDNNEVLHITTGGSLREFLKNDNYTSRKSKDIVNAGGLMSEFLIIWLWTNIFINTLKGGESVILDGAPRKMIEVKALDTAIDFYGFTDPIVIYLDVSESWAKDRLTQRGREDDKNIEEMNRKMAWFETDVMHCVDWYKNIDTRYNFIHVNGERSVEEIHADIISKI